MPEQELDITQNITGGVGHNIAGRDLIVGLTAGEVSLLLDKLHKEYQPKPFDGRSPYVGLAWFGVDDADRFFGRERLTQQLVKRVEGSRFLVIAGPSGSGKSSLARAGLLNALEKGALKRSEQWLYGTLVPGRRPLESLGRVVENLLKDLRAGDDLRKEGWADKTRLHRWLEAALGDQPTRRAILLVDQFEESFTQADDLERAAFINLLVHAATIENGRVTVVCVTRSDFIGNWAAYANLNEQLSHAFDQIPPMQPDELISAIARPALQVGLQIDPELVTQILSDMRDAPGALPLMQFALDDLFNYARSKGVIALTRDDYLERGGLQKALARHADGEFAKLTADEQQIARSVFLGLIEPGRDTSDGRTPDTKRNALLQELVPDGGELGLTRNVISKLADARLITTDKQDGHDVVTLAHDRLIDAWEWLRRLVNDNRETIELQNQIAEDAQEWQRHARDPSYLYTGARLVASRERLAGIPVQSTLTRIFLETGIAGDEEKRRQEEARRQKELDDAKALAEEQRRRADAEFHRRIESESRQLAAQSVSLLGDAYDLALLLSVEANRAFDTFEARSALYTALQHNPPLKIFLRPFIKAIPLLKAQRHPALVFSADGQTLVSVGGFYSDAVIIWDLTAFQPVTTLSSGDGIVVNTVTCSPDAGIVAAGREDGTILLWDVKREAQLCPPLIHCNSKSEFKPITSLSFSPVEGLLASGAHSNTVALWDAATGNLVKQFHFRDTLLVSHVAFSSTGKFLSAVGMCSLQESWREEFTLIWNMATEQCLGRLEGRGLAFSPFSQLLALVSKDDEGVSLWDVDAMMDKDLFMIPESQLIESLSFSHDGRMLAAGRLKSGIILWDVFNNQPIKEPLEGHVRGSVESVAISPDGLTVASSGFDDAIILWNPTEPRSLSRFFASEVGYAEIKFSPDGKFLMCAADETLLLWDIATAQIARTYHVGGEVKNFFGLHGDLVAVLASNHAVRLIETSAESVPPETPVGFTDLSAMALSPDGDSLAFGREDGSVLFWHITTRQLLKEPLATGNASRVTRLAFSPDGGLLAVGHEDGSINTCRAGNYPTEHFTKIDDDLVDLSFHPDGKMLLATGHERMYLFNVETRRLINHYSTGSGVGAPLHAVFSPDGTMLAWFTYSRNVISLMDARARQRFGPPLTYEDNVAWSFAFSPDGKTLAVSYETAVVFWDFDMESWVKRAYDIANRELTLAEREQYMSAAQTVTS